MYKTIQLGQKIFRSKWVKSALEKTKDLSPLITKKISDGVQISDFLLEQVNIKSSNNFSKAIFMILAIDLSGADHY